MSDKKPTVHTCIEKENELVTVRRARSFFSPARELSLLRKTCAQWESQQSGVALSVDRYGPKADNRFVEICVFGVVSDDWPGMGETCLGIVHERGWNVHYAQGLVLEHHDTDLGVFIMAIGIEHEKDQTRMTIELPGIITELRSLGVGRRAKMLLLAKEAKKLALLSKVVEELANQSSGDELQDITAPLGESTKFFAARTDEYMEAWSPHELAYQIISNYRLLKKVRGSGGIGTVLIEDRSALHEERSCLTVVGLARDVTVDECLRVIGDTLGFHEQHHLIEFTTKDGLKLVRIEVGQQGGQPLSASQLKELELSLREMLAGRRIAWEHSIANRGGFEQYLRAIIPLLQREQEASGLPQVYISPTTREKVSAGYKILFVYGAPEDGSRPSIQLSEYMQSIKGIDFVSSSSPRTMGDQRLFVINVKADLSRFSDTEEIYTALKEAVGNVFTRFRDFDEGMRRLDMTKLKGIEANFSEREQRKVDRIFYAIDDFSRLSMGSDEIVKLIHLGLETLEILDTRIESDQIPVFRHEQLRDHTGDISSILLAVAVPKGRGIPNCIRDLSSKANVMVSQIRHGEGELLLCRVVGFVGETPGEEIIDSVLHCISRPVHTT